MFLVAFAYIAVAIVVFFGVMAALLKFWPKSFDQLCDFLFPEPAEEPASELDLFDAELDLDAEYEQRHRAQAARRRGQELPPIESIGFRSLDDIRRDYNRKDGAA